MITPNYLLIGVIGHLHDFGAAIVQYVGILVRTSIALLSWGSHRVAT